MSSRTINILMTGAGAPGAPGIIHCLKQDSNIHLTVGDADPDATGRYLHSDFVVLPGADNPDFANLLLKICKEKNIGIVLPLVTRELLPLSKNKKTFSDNGICVMVSSEEAVAVANNKSLCYTFLRDKGIDIPDFHVVTTISSFKKAATSLGFPQKPFCFKPSVSNGSRGVRIVSDSINETNLLFNHKPYHIFMSFTQVINVLSSKNFPELLVSAYLPGDEFSVDCLAYHGEAKLVVPRIRKKMINGISVLGEFIHHKKIIAYCTGILKAIGLHGNIGIQVKLSADGEPMLLEINPRVQGTTVAALGAGINFPLLAVQQEMGIITDPVEHEVKWGTRFSRFWTEVFY